MKGRDKGEDGWESKEMERWSRGRGISRRDSLGVSGRQGGMA